MHILNRKKEREREKATRLIHCQGCAFIWDHQGWVQIKYICVKYIQIKEIYIYIIYGIIVTLHIHWWYMCGLEMTNRTAGVGSHTHTHTHIPETFTFSSACLRAHTHLHRHNQKWRPRGLYKPFTPHSCIHIQRCWEHLTSGNYEPLCTRTTAHTCTQCDLLKSPGLLNVTYRISNFEEPLIFSAIMRTTFELVATLLYIGSSLAF